MAYRLVMWIKKFSLDAEVTKVDRKELLTLRTQSTHRLLPSIHT